MIEIRFHGRGGQGAVTSAEIVAVSAIECGKFAQAFPSFGPERRGAPVVAFARIDERPILNRSAILRPDVVIVLDPALIRLVRVADGLKEGGILVVNTSKGEAEIRDATLFTGKVALVDANRIAVEVIGRAITNMVMLGAFIGATALVDQASIEATIAERFGGLLGKKNIEALRRATKETTVAGSAAGGGKENAQ